MSGRDWINWEKYYPDDLNKDNKVKTGQDYFTIPVLDLKIGEEYSFNFRWVYPDKKVSPWSDGLTLTTASYTTALTKPVVTVTPASLGYTVSYTKQTDKNFEHAIIEESVSDSNTAPASGWTEVSVSSTNPTTITVGDILKRWVRVKLIDKILGNTAYSDPVAVTPVDPVAAALDITPPTVASSVSGVWSGNNIIITATVSADAKKFIIRLTNGSTEGFFTKFPTASGTSQTILLTEQELYDTLGSYFTSFNGLFISTDSLDNRDTGVAFTVSEKANELASVTPTFTLVPISNGYSVTYTLPTGAAYAKVYASSISGFTPNDFTNLVYSGSSPGIIIDSAYTLKYVKIKYFKTDGSAVDDCFGRLRSEGYTIYGTSPASNSLSIHDFPILPNQKVALVFGNEHEGISEEVKSKVDGLVHIPMRGFTESFNISVSASIFLYELIKRVNDMKIPNFNLTEKEQAALRLRWYKLIVPHADIHERYFRQQIQNL